MGQMHIPIIRKGGFQVRTDLGRAQPNSKLSFNHGSQLRMSSNLQLLGPVPAARCEPVHMKRPVTVCGVGIKSKFAANR